MSATKRRLTCEEDGQGFTFPDFETSRSKRKVTAPAIDICSLPIEGISPPFEPNRALLRSVFFLNEDLNKYVSVAFYPTQGYAAYVEFGAAKAVPIRLTEQQVIALTEHLPRLCDALCANIHYTSSVHDGFKINTTGTYKIARMYLGMCKHGKHIAFKMQVQRYLDNVMYIIVNQLKTYNIAQSDVMTYAMSAMASNDYIQPLSPYSKSIIF